MKQLDPIIAVEGQAIFTIPDRYLPGTIIVPVNGHVIQPNDFAATDGRTMTLATSLHRGDELGAIVFGAA